MPVHISAYMRLSRSITTLRRELDAMDMRLELIERTISAAPGVRPRPLARGESHMQGAAE